MKKDWLNIPTVELTSID